MDDKSYSETDANNAPAPIVPVGAVVLTATGTSDKSKLTGCYFVISGTSWTLYNKGGNVLTTGLMSATSFGFQHDAVKGSTTTKINWSVTSFVMATANNITTATGNWSNDDPDSTGGPQSGSFQGSSSGTIDPVATTSASA